MLKLANRARLTRTASLGVLVAAILALGIQGAPAATGFYGPADCTKTWAGPNGGEWRDGPWSPAGNPGETDVVCITAGHVSLGGVTVIGAYEAPVEGLVVTGDAQLDVSLGSGLQPLELIGAHANSSASNIHFDGGSQLVGAADLEVTNSIALIEMEVTGAGGARLIVRSSVGTNATLASFVGLSDRTLVIEQGAMVRDLGRTRLSNGAVIDNFGTWRIEEGGIEGNITAQSGTFVNESTGVLLKTSANAMSKLDVRVKNDGLIETQSGTLVIGSTDIATGKVISLSEDPAIVSGSGTFAPAIVHSHGKLSPGEGVGVMHIAGNYEMHGNNPALGAPHPLLAIEVGGTGAAQSDRLDVGSRCALDGALEVTLVGGYAPVLGDQIEIVRCAGGASGVFAEKRLPSLGSCLFFDVVYNASNVVLEVKSTCPVDVTPPTISCGGPDGVWHADDVSILCTASDGDSGLKDPADASFTLTTSVPAGTADANASTGSRLVCDNALNCAQAGPISGNMVDKEPPTIVIDAPAGAYSTGAPVSASYGCTDHSGSGLASCAGPVANGGAIDTGHAYSDTFTVEAEDNVGNRATNSSDYTVSNVRRRWTRADRTAATRAR